MVSDSPNSNAASPHSDVPSSTEVGNTEKEKSLSDLLIGSKYQSLVFIGQCMNFFGMGKVLAFLVGAAIVYGVSLFRPLPYAKVESSPDGKSAHSAALSPDDAKKVKLHGFVNDGQNRPKEGFFVAVIASQHGPFFPRNGEFSIPVLQSDKYSIALWSEDRQVQVYSELSAEPDGVGFTVGDLRLVPATSLAPVSLGASAVLKTKSTDPVMAKSARSNDRFKAYTLSEE